MKRAARIAGLLCFFISSLTLAAIITTGGGNVAAFEPIRATYTAGQFGAALENEANADQNTVLFCDFSNPDGTTSNPLCGISGVRHQGVGPLSVANNLSQDENTMRYAGDFRTCYIIEAVSLAADAQLFVATDGGASGYGVILKANGSVEFSTFAAGPTSTVSTSAAGGIVVGQKNLVCLGRSGTNQILSVNGVNTTTANAKVVTPNDVVYIGRDYAGALAGTFKLYEMATSAVAATTAYFDSVWTAATTCRSAGRCLPAMTGEQLYLTGEEYLAGQNPWCGDAGACVGTLSFSIAGQPLPAKSRYNWPSLAWTQVGAVPRVTASNVYSRGYGAKHAGLGPFSDANYLNLGAGAGVLHMQQHTYCIIFKPTSFATNQTLFSTFAGVYVTSNASADFSIVYNGATKLQTAVAGVDNVLCWGVEGANARAKINADAVSADWSPPAGWTPGTTAPMIGRYQNAGTPAGAIVIKEFFATSTLPTAAYLTALNTAALSCAHPGRCFEQDANTAMHCFANDGGKWECPVNTGATAWTVNGTIPAAATAKHDWPYQADKRDAEGAGPFSAANAFTLGTGSDVLDFAGDFMRCVAFTPNTCTAAPVLEANGTAGTSGYYLTLDNTCKAILTTAAVAGQLTQTTANAAVTGAPNIVCYGRAAGSGYIKLNDSTTVTSAARTTQDSTTVARIGNWNDTTLAFDGIVHVTWASATAFSEATAVRIQRRFLSHTGTQDQPISITRTTVATEVVDGKMYRAPAGTLRSVPAGKLIEGSVTNAALYSSQLDNAAWVLQGTASVVADQGIAMDGTLTLEAVTSASVVTPDSLLQAVTTASSATFSATSQFRASAGSQVGSVGVVCTGTTLTSCASCWRSDGGTCTVATSGIIGYAYGTGTTAQPIRMGVNCTCGVAITTPSVMVTAGQYGVSTGTVLAGSAQIEIGTFPHEYCGPSTATAVTCNADAVTVANPLRPNGADWTNLLLQSEAFNTTWVPIVNPGTMVVTPNAVVAPDGSFTGDLVTVSAAIDGAGEYAVLRQNPVVGAAAGAVSGGVWAKAGTINTIWFLVYDGAYRILRQCNLTTEWALCSDTGTATGVWYADIGNIYNVTNTATASGTYYLWAGQATATATMQPYCPTTTTARTCGNGGATGKVTVNAALQNTTLANAAWTKAATVTVADADATCPVDEKGNRGTLVTSGTDGNGVSQDVALTTTRSAYLSFPSGGAACDVTWGDFDKTGAADLTLSATPVRFAAYTAGNTGVNVYRKTGGCASWCQSSTQLEAIATGAGPYCGPTFASARTCAPQQRHCTQIVDATPLGGREWSAVAAYLWSSGVNGAVNTTALRAHTDGKLYLDSYDAAGVLSQLSYTHSFAAGSTHTLTACNFDGTLSLTVDGTTITPTGTVLPGTSVRALYATIGVGQKGDGTLQWNGTIGAIRFNSTGQPKDFPVTP